tara:strand:- start:989 stop:1351 length:363 start_codon:yes stop_codon:yes gene_type:complete
MNKKIEKRADERLKQVSKVIGRLKHIKTGVLWPMNIMNWGRGSSYGQPYIHIQPKVMADKMKTPQPKKSDVEARVAWDKTHGWHQGQLMQKVRTKLHNAGITFYAYREMALSQSIIVKVK